MFIILLTSSDVNLFLISRMSCSRQPAPNRHWQRYPVCSPCLTSPCRPYHWPIVGASGGWLTICLCPTSQRTLPMPTVTLSLTPIPTNQVHEILNFKKKKKINKKFNSYSYFHILLRRFCLLGLGSLASPSQLFGQPQVAAPQFFLTGQGSRSFCM